METAYAIKRNDGKYFKGEHKFSNLLSKATLYTTTNLANARGRAECGEVGYKVVKVTLSIDGEGADGHEKKHENN